MPMVTYVDPNPNAEVVYPSPREMELQAWIDVAVESNRAIDTYLRTVDPTLPEHYGMPVDGVRRVVESLRHETTERGRTFAALDRLAGKVAAMHPGARVGLSVSVVDGDWCIYINGPGAIFGHGIADIAQAESDLGRSDWSVPVYYPKQED